MSRHCSEAVVGWVRVQHLVRFARHNWPTGISVVDGGREEGTPDTDPSILLYHN